MRQWPPQTGIGCLSVEWRDDVVRDETIRLFETVGFHGLGYAEFKVDERTGKHLIIEPNVARPTGRSAMAEAGGVELLLAMYRDALGEPLPDRLEQSYRGVKWIHLRQDVRAAWTYWRAGQLSLRRWRESWSGPKCYAILSWSDPAPFFSDLLEVGRRAVSRVFKRRQQPLVQIP
jgi:predicted ATP-grasp superfamily ATP-dependent carboligase